MIRFKASSELKIVKPELDFIIRTWAKNSNQSFKWVDSEGISIGTDLESDLQVSANFVQQKYDRIKMNKAGVVENETGRPDYITTIFYLLNSVQEYYDTNPDELGRFRYTNSYQYKLKNSDENLVQNCFDMISTLAGIPLRMEKSSFFLTHDVDLVYSAWIEDGFNVLKKGRIDLFFNFLFNIVIRRPDWLNMDKIMKLESMYDCKSVFYWIVNKGKINRRERNADYSFQSPTIQKQFEFINENGFENGIHKSVSNSTFKEEFVKFGSPPLANRYHYLKFTLPKGYSDIENAGLKLDASLGFAEQPGFRNNYGLPFNPYNIAERRAYTFVEVPLHIMDRTFFQYKKATILEAENEIFSFFSKNSKNSVISVLWHNNFFTDYKFKGYLGLYKKILAYIRDNSFRTISQNEIIQKFSITNEN